MTQLGLDFNTPSAESVTQLALGFVRQIPLRYIKEQKDRVETALINNQHLSIQIDKLEVINRLMDLRIALAALDSGLGFDPSRFEVPIAVKPQKE